MLNHIMIGSGDIERSKSFYTAVLGVLGAGEPMAHVNDTGQTRLFYMHDGDTFSISEPINGEPVSCANGSTIGFAAATTEAADAWHAAGLASGGVTCEEPPGVREGGMGPLYLAYLRDPSGNKICALVRV